jgi:hypothetical protein
MYVFHHPLQILWFINSEYSEADVPLNQQTNSKYLVSVVSDVDLV